MAEFYHANFDTIWFVIMSVIVFFLTAICKLPIKALTSKLVRNLKVDDFATKEEYDAEYAKKDRARKAWNTVILALPFGFGILAEWFFSLSVVTDFVVANGVYIGVASISIYAFVERFFTGSSTISEEYESEEGQKVIDAVEDVLGVSLPDTKKSDENDEKAECAETAKPSASDVMSKIDEILK